ncbi:sulfatase [Cryobacterium lactosi]|uniref:Sulfatase n=1 Tax=Cryobacterium lactosi TaxID=1259202 RepID=A0A4R9BYD9_9MICO|nr:sulfatase-like hydrolase/transferase [Cryobacterium lactosi]TFD94123.1 sulfatase [Cryobacterium lactosi]
MNQLPAETKKPNIVMIMTDQHRADFSKLSGLSIDTTPYLDHMATAGAHFPRAYTSSPACVPARTSLLTGRFPLAHRVTQNSNAQEAYFSQDAIDVLRSSGYRTVFAGKPHMHRGPDDFDSFSGPYFHTDGPENTPEDEAFDRWLDNLDHGVSHVPTPFSVKQQLAYRIVDDAIAATTEVDDPQPTFLWVSFPEPHNPYQVPEPYFSMFAESDLPERAHGPEAAQAKGGHWAWLQSLVESKRPGYDDEWRRYRANYCGQLRLLDDQIKRLVTHVEATLTGETLFIFLSDHGDYVGEYGMQRKGAGMPEVLMRIPFFMTGAGVRPGQTRDEFISIVDVFPTLCEIVDAAIPMGVQGRSLAPLLKGDAPDTGEFDSIYAERGFGGLTYQASEMPPLHFPVSGPTFDELNTVTQSGRTKMLRYDHYKLLVHSDNTGELYDLDADPTEVDDRFEDPEMAEVRHELVWRLMQWLLRLQDDLPVGAYTAKIAPHNWAGAAASTRSSEHNTTAE